MAAGEEGEGIKLFGKTIGQREKQPEKIITCLRCKSMETKFCYFNNYNVNQPRHFCKGCQRYWTAGGALRNVPVGAGRRKIKPPGKSLGGLHQFEDLQVVAAAVYGGFRYVLPEKRLRSSSGRKKDRDKKIDTMDERRLQRYITTRLCSKQG